MEGKTLGKVKMQMRDNGGDRSGATSAFVPTCGFVMRCTRIGAEGIKTLHLVLHQLQ